MTDTDERELMAAAEAVAGRVAAGADPTEAAAAVAADRGLTPGRLKIVCAAVNVGRQLAQQEAEPTASAKAAVFPVADADRAALLARGRAAGPAKTAAAPPPPPAAGWDPPPPPARPAAKVAAAPPPDPAPPAPAATRLLRARAEARKAAALADQAAQARADAQAAADGAYLGLVDYFRRDPAGRLSGPTVVKAARAYIGDAEAGLAAAAHARAGVADGPAEDRTFDPAARPFRLLLAAKAAAAEYHRLAPPPAPPKTAAGLLQVPAVGAGLWAASNQMFNRAPDPGRVDADTQSVLDRLNDPGHADELRRIRVRAMLGQFLQDPEDPISGYPAERVIDSYNQLAQLAPRAAEQAALAGPWLRRSLAGRTETHEAKTVLDADRALAAKPPTGGLS